MKVKYHLPGIGKNKKIKEQRKKPLPLSLMDNIEIIHTYDKSKRAWIHRRRDKKHIINGDDI